MKKEYNKIKYKCDKCGTVLIIGYDIGQEVSKELNCSIYQKIANIVFNNKNETDCEGKLRIYTAADSIKELEEMSRVQKDE